VAVVLGTVGMVAGSWLVARAPFVVAEAPLLVIGVAATVAVVDRIWEWTGGAS